MTIQYRLMIGLALAVSTRVASAAATAPSSAPDREAHAGRAVTISAPGDATRVPSRGDEPDAEAGDGGFFTLTKTCLLLGTLGAFVLVARRRGMD